MSDNKILAGDNKVAPGGPKDVDHSVEENNETADILNGSRDGDTSQRGDGEAAEEQDDTPSRDALLKKHITEFMESGPGLAFNVSVMVMSLLSFIIFIVLTYVDSAMWDPCCQKEHDQRLAKREYELTLEAWGYYDDQIRDYEIALDAFNIEQEST